MLADFQQRYIDLCITHLKRQIGLIDDSIDKMKSELKPIYSDIDAKINSINYEVNEFNKEFFIKRDDKIKRILKYDGPTKYSVKEYKNSFKDNSILSNFNDFKRSVGNNNFKRNPTSSFNDIKKDTSFSSSKSNTNINNYTFRKSNNINLHTNSNNMNNSINNKKKNNNNENNNNSSSSSKNGNSNKKNKQNKRLNDGSNKRNVKFSSRGGNANKSNTNTNSKQVFNNKD